MPKLFEVGGCVRDSIIGVHTNDIDFTFVLDDLNQTVDQGWEDMLKFLHEQKFKIFLETKDCFTVRAKFPDGHQHEGLVADFVMARKEVGYILGTRQPILELGTLQDDLIRRDFTCNAIAMDLDGNLIDPFDGKTAIKNKVLDTPLDPQKTFFDDPLRMIRALRFSITKGFTIAPRVWDTIMHNPDIIKKLKEVVSVERIQTEVTKMMKHDTVATLRLFAEIDEKHPELLEIIFSKGIWLMPTTKQVK